MPMNEPDLPEFEAEQKNLRLATRVPLIVEKIPIEDGQKTFFGYAKNISRGGLFIATVKPREPGEEFTIELTLPVKPKHVIRCRCEVLWKRHYQKKHPHEPGMGMRFLDLADADADKIDAWVEDQIKEPSE
jgi:uncharacterized protein (TIGR02266 family)